MADATIRLRRLDDTGMTVLDPGEDIRGADVLDPAGEKIGKVSALLVDEAESRVRMLEVASGGFLGIGRDHVLLPVDAITAVTEDEVTIDQTRDRVSGSPAYDPELVVDQSYASGVYGHYGLGPYWAAGYAYPGVYPRVPR